MTQPGDAPGSLPPAGWYADPSAPAGRTGRRYWNGATWTEHVVADPAVPLVGYRTTPDGQRLAGWGRRLGAYAIDSVVTFVLAVVLGFPFVRSLLREYGAYIDRVLDASRTGAQPPGQLDLYRQIYPSLLGYTAVVLVVVVVYQSVFLRTRSGTPGKLLLGLRVRLREQPGRLPWSAIARRLGSTHVAAVVLSLIPFVGSLLGLYFLLDGLWPLWDSRRQALHDKIARTNVVQV